MKLEIHILQNLAPSNLNRDDTGAPKDCEFGGFRRARVSSQCWKRAVRDAFKVDATLPAGELAVRTKRLVDEVAKHTGRDAAASQPIVRAMLQGAGLGVKDDKGSVKTEYLLYLPERHIKALGKVAAEHWDDLAALATAEAAPEAPSEPAEAAEVEGDAKGKKAKGAKAPTARQQKAKKEAAFPPAIAKKVVELLRDGSGAPDLALFGRMIADKPDWNVDAACQVAHALSTNRIAMEFDFYTAVDDLRPGDTTGSDMMGTVQFNSACFYRYALVDLAALGANLAASGDAKDADPVTVKRSLDAFVRAFVRAIPSGKQNSMAAHSPPSYVLAVLRASGSPVSLANAFVKPVRPTSEHDLVGGSIAALEKHLQDLSRMYGAGDIAAAVSISERELTGAAGGVDIDRASSLDALLDTVRARAFAGAAA